MSLALAQSANESAWGTSRFALKANNLFGQWCFSKGCGIVPLSRPVGAKFEMAKFTNPEQSVVAYMHNLNTNRAYINFRKMRKNMRGMNVPLSGAVLAEGLISYSQRRGAYIKELQAMIRVNKLSQYDSL